MLGRYWTKIRGFHCQRCQFLQFGLLEIWSTKRLLALFPPSIYGLWCPYLQDTRPSVRWCDCSPQNHLARDFHGDHQRYGWKFDWSRSKLLGFFLLPSQRAARVCSLTPDPRWFDLWRHGADEESCLLGLQARSFQNVPNQDCQMGPRNLRCCLGNKWNSSSIWIGCWI